jgi:hypothetical protein
VRLELRNADSGSTGAQGRAELAMLALARGPRTAAISWYTKHLLAVAADLSAT